MSASSVLIRNPDTQDYTKVTLYRKIPLLSWLNQAIKNVVAELLPNEDERRAVLSNCEFGSRKKGLAIDAAAILVDIVHSELNEANITRVLLMDI